MSFSITKAEINQAATKVRVAWQFTTADGSVGNTTWLNTNGTDAASINEAAMLQWLEDQLPTMSTTDADGNSVSQTIQETLTAQIAENAAREAEEASLTIVHNIQLAS